MKLFTVLYHSSYQPESCLVLWESRKVLQKKRRRFLLKTRQLNYLWRLLIHRLIVIIHEFTADLTTLQHLCQPFNFLERAGFGDGFTNLLNVGGVCVNLRFACVIDGICNAEFCLLLDLFLHFLALDALEESCRLLSFLLLNLLEVQQAKMW